MPTGLPNADAYYALAQKDLAGLLSADVSLEAGELANPTSRPTPQSTLIRLPTGQHVLRVDRPSLAFATSEMVLKRAYGEALEELSQVPAGFAVTASADVLTRAVATRCAVAHPERGTDVERTLRAVMQQATKTYEGAAIVLNAVIDLTDYSAGQPLHEFFEQPWASVLASGLTTALQVSAAGTAIGVVDLPPPDAPLFAPDRFASLAAWSTTPGHVALAATRSGEIYVFVEGQVLFVHRNSAWRGFPIEAVRGSSWFTTQGGIPQSTKQGVIRALLDASAAHHGACVGVIRAPNVPTAIHQLVSEDDQWSNDRKSRLFGTNDFFELSRRQQLEIISMDGATLLDRQGHILAAGAILQIRSGSSGGGRTAAAKAIGHYGVGIKVSQDGPVEAFRGEQEETSFVMG